MKFLSGYYRHCLLAFALLFMAVQVCFAQIEFTEHTIAVHFLSAACVYAADVDGDGDMDVLGAAAGASDITWWENDGEQNFTEHTIEVIFHWANSVYAADLDDDGDMDVLGSSYNDDEITWWENDGAQNFTEHTIAEDYDRACSVYAADIDGDGDMDVLGTAIHANEITWWESDLDPVFGWLALPDTNFVEDGSLQLSLEYLHQHICSPHFEKEDLVISTEDGEHLSGELNDEGLTITTDQGWFGIDSLMMIVTDPDENSGTTYLRLTVIEFNAASEPPLSEIPSEFTLLEPYPNPFNSTTTITYALPTRAPRFPSGFTISPVVVLKR